MTSLDEKLERMINLTDKEEKEDSEAEYGFFLFFTEKNFEEPLVSANLQYEQPTLKLTWFQLLFH